MMATLSKAAQQGQVHFCHCAYGVLPFLPVFRAHRGEVLYTAQEAAGQFSVLDLQDWSKTFYACPGLVSEADIRLHIESTIGRLAERIGERSWAA